MSSKRDEEWLDEKIGESFDGSYPEFDAERWRQRFREEYKLAAELRTGQRRRRILARRITELAAAAVIIVAFGLSVIYLRPGQKKKELNIQAAKSPAELVSFLSLNMAYRRGGMEAVDRQLDKASEVLGPRAPSMSLDETLAEFNGDNGKG